MRGGVAFAIGIAIAAWVSSSSEARADDPSQQPPDDLSPDDQSDDAAPTSEDEDLFDLELGELLDVVVVTSQRREEPLQDIPIAITAIDRTVLRIADINSTARVLEYVPNAAFGERAALGDRTTDIAIRGVTDDYAFQDDPFAKAIGFYLDEVNIAVVATGTVNPQLYDVERVEVLRGPQGTYFGRNSLGGAVNVVTVEPQDELETEARLDYGRFNTLTAAGMFNVPVLDNLFVRGVGYWEQSDGFIDNVNPSGAPESDYRYGHARLRAKWQPTSDATFDVSATYTRESSGLNATVPTGVISLDTQGQIPGATADAQGLGFYPANKDTVNHNIDESTVNDYWFLNGRLWLDTEHFVVRGVTGIIFSTFDRTFDQDVTGADLFGSADDASTFSWSQEFRLESPSDQGVVWIAGALVAQDDVDQLFSVNAGTEAALGGEPIPPGFPLFVSRERFKTTTAALFGDLRTDIVGGLAASLGGRYTFDRVSAATLDAIRFGEPRQLADDRDSFHNVSPSLALSYDWTDDVFSYARATRGYKTGGVQLNEQLGTQRFRPEDMWSFEVGAKSEPIEQRLRLNGAAFYYRRRDVQVVSEQTFVEPGTAVGPVSFTTNDGNIEAYGVELELTAAWPEHLRTSAALGLQRVEFFDFSNGFLQGNSIDFSGLRVPMAPVATANVQLQYDFDLIADETSFARAEWYYRSSMTSDLEGVASTGELLDTDGNPVDLPAFPYQIPGYHVVNLRVGQSYQGFDLIGYVENALGETYYNSTADDFGLGGIRVEPHPRTWGAQLRYSY